MDVTDLEVTKDVDPSKRGQETGRMNEESSASNEGSEESIELTEEQQKYYKLMMECMALEMKEFEDSRRNQEDREKQQCNDNGSNILCFKEKSNSESEEPITEEEMARKAESTHVLIKNHTRIKKNLE